MSLTIHKKPVNRPVQPPRSGKALLRWLIILSILSASIVGAWLAIRQVKWTSEESGPTMYVVERGEFFNEITERGNVESASNVEVRCEVKSRGRGSATILWIIPEGTNVKPGDKLIEFDASAFESDMTQQQITCSNSQASLTQAENNFKNAKAALNEYIEGTYELDKMGIKIKEFTAEEEKRQAQQKVEYTEELARKGYVTDLRLQKDKIALDKALLNVKSANLEMRVLDEYKKPKMINQLESEIKTAEANLNSAKARHDLDVAELELIKEQIGKCLVYSKETGQVVYANETNRHGGQEIIIEEGTTVREQQVVIRLPDPKRMQVVANINEAKVTLVNVGQHVEVKLDAMPDVALDGVVEKVDEYPAPAAWWAGNIKQYETCIRIVDVSVPLKPGLTAEIRIEIERIPDCIQIPVQSLFEHGGKYYCIKRDPADAKNWIAHEVQIGSTNDKFVVITSGLEPGDQIVHAAFSYRNKVKLPELPPDFKNGKKRRSRAPGAATGTAGEAPAGTEAASEQPSPAAGKRDFFKEMDKNSDGRLTKDEVPTPMQEMFSRVDTNSDNAIDKAEWAKVQAMMAGARKGQGPGGGPQEGKGPQGEGQGGQPRTDGGGQGGQP